MYVAVKGGEQAIANAHQQMTAYRRGDRTLEGLSVVQIMHQLPFAVARVMAEGALFDRQLAALAVKQSAGDLIEAIFLLRAYRTTLPRFSTSLPIETTNMRVSRRVSATYKDLPGGQVLGATFDYSHRLLDFKLLAETEAELSAEADGAEHPDALQHDKPDDPASVPRVMGILERENLMVEERDDGEEPTDITRDPVAYPCDRATRLQSLTRGDEGFMLSLGYSTQRGYGRNHPFAGEIRIGEVEVLFVPPELDFAVSVGDIEVTECETVNGFTDVSDVTHSRQEMVQDNDNDDVEDKKNHVEDKVENEHRNHAARPENDAPRMQTSSTDFRFTRGYGLTFGYNERKAMAMALVDRALQAPKYQEEINAPAQQEEFVLSHCDNVEAAGFVSHLKLPHYVDFQSELELLRRLRCEQASASQPHDDERIDAQPNDAQPNDAGPEPAKQSSQETTV
jgi:alpha-D-ribose 1-methylphosphonate 5-triphosphate synthase subunit PhnI